MKNIITIAVIFFSAFQLFSQKVCVSEKEVFIDVNAINKCAVKKDAVKIKKSKNKNAINSSVRYLKKRIYLNKVVFLASNLKTNTVVDVKKETENKIDKNLLIILKKESEKEIVSFDAVDNIPLFSSCIENSLDKIECFNNEMEKHIINNFVYPKEALKKGIEANLEVSFVIDIHGKLQNIKIEGTGNQENAILKKEAMRIVLLLPKFTPGKQKDANVNVLYKFPMNFTLN